VSQHSVKDALWQKIVAEERGKCKAAGRRGLCWLCHNPIDTTLPKEHKKSFTLDHVDVVAKGGDKHRRSNLKWAHRDCNSRRGDGTTSHIFTTRKW